LIQKLTVVTTIPWFVGSKNSKNLNFCMKNRNKFSEV
jgi:hypothetical protein